MTFDLTDPTETFIIRGIHGDECPFCGGLMTHYGDRTSSGGHCRDCEYGYLDKEPYHIEFTTVDEIREANEP